MSQIAAVLLIPAEGDPHGLLAFGLGGSAPPTAHSGVTPARVHEECLDCDSGDHYHERDDNDEDDYGWHTHCDECGERWPCPKAGKVESPRVERWALIPTLKVHEHYFVLRPKALVLAWDGEPVAEGLDRAARCLARHHTGGSNVAPALDIVHEHLFYEACRVLGTIVLLDANGKEITP